MAADEKWYFTKEQLTNTPSRRCGIDSDKELSYRQQAANFIQDLGQRLVVSQLCINTAIVYMHRFYVFHSLSQFHRNAIAAAALFLAAKVEEQPRKLEHVIKMAHMCLHQPPPDVRSEQYLEQAQDLVFNENVLLQTLGFDVAIDHPHTHVVRCCQLVKASKDLAQTSYFMASNSLHLTTMCLQYKPTVVACFCIHLACKWSNWEIPQSNEGKHWFWYVDRTVTSELLQQLTAEFLHIFDKCPSRLKRKIMSISATQSPSISHPSLPNSPFDAEPRKVQSPATTAEGGPIFHSSRSHHGEKQEDKKGLAPPSSRPPVDYREYREKKERERFEREKAAAGAATSSSSSTLLSVSSSATSASAASTTVASSHLPEINKHHSHHHKPVSSSNVVNKHPISAGQKSTLHHNHHHRPDLKVGQPVPQRHSSSGQVRESSRDSNRQRLQREYNSSGGANSASLQYHGHSTHQMKDANLDSSSTETDIHRSDVSTSQDLSGSMSLQDKLSNNNHNVHRSSSVDKHQSHDKGLYDPRHKPMDHKKEGDQKPYNKYLDPSRTERQRKPDSLEQRSEEVRKLIEKPLTLPKSSLEASYAANAQKQFHHSKYNQTDKIQSNSGITSSDSKLSVGQNAFTQEKSPSSVSTSSIYPPKMQQSKIVPGQLSAHGVSQILKDTIKNGGTSLASLNNIDDPKAEKRPRYDDTNKSTSDLQQPILQTPPGKHKSLFSPEKVPSSRDTHVQKSKTKQKTPPSAAKVPKERIPEVSIGNLPLSFTSPPGMQQAESIGSIKRSATDSCTTSHKRHRTSNNDESVQQVKPKVEDNSSFEAVKMLGRVPELIQPIRDNPANGKTASNLSDIKPTELNKLFEPESMLRFSSTSVNQLGIANGIDTIFVKQEPKDFHVSTDPFKTEMSLKLENPPLKTEYSSPMKSAQSISALLQEPLTSMPSLLQNMQPYGQMTTQQTHQEQVQQPQQPQPLQQQPQPQPQPQPQQQQQQQQQQSGHHNNHHYLHHHPHSHLQQQQPLQTILSTDQVTMQTHCMAIPPANEVAVASTVDISVLSVPVQSSTESVVSVPIPNTPAVVPLEEKRSEHHKSEKKKKEKKHKHKDKDRSKEKHKRKHKDKDKEKHREKDKDKEKGEETVAAVPIKITIPKDKLNLSTETTAGGSVSASTSEKTKSPPNTSIKIIIPKERLKGADNVSNSPGQSVSVQAPLKIKIRTDGISRISGGSNTVGGNVSAGLPEFPVESRKRERERERERDRDRDRDRERERIDNKESPTVGVPPTKKQPQMTSLGYGQHRPSERQNGRHYGSSSNNKVRGGSRGGRQYVARGPPPAGSAAAHYGAPGQRDGYYQQDNYNSNGPRNPHHPHPLPARPDKNYTRTPHVTQSQTDSYFFANYPPPSLYNPAGYIYDPALFYQQYQQQQQQQHSQQQQQYSMYPAGNVIITADGAIDTSVPPPNIHHTQSHLIQPSIPTSRQETNSPPPLPSGPPPSSSPPPPPPPE